MKLLEKGRIGTMQLKNRVCMCPMGVGGLPDPDGGFSTRSKDYYVARARGGTGLIISCTTLVTTEIEKDMTSLVYVLDSRDKLGRLNDMVEEIHSYGSKLCLQLSAGLGRVCYILPGAVNPPVAPSVQPSLWDPNINCRALTRDEIKGLVKAFGNAAMLAKSAGADSVEIHGYGGYLIDQFNTALWNKRDDEYGGDIKGRLRFSMEIIREIKDVCGKDFPVLYKFTPKHYIEGGRELDEGLEMAKLLEEAGVDALHVDKACFEKWHLTIPSVYQPPASQIDLSVAVKGVVDIPVISHGKLGDPELAESLLQDGKTDFIGLGRSLLAEPDWVNKIKENRPEDITPCIVCFEGCTSRVFDGKYISCALNPACGKEKDYGINPASKQKKVLVIGGGPGGIESALIAAQRGHQVLLWEKSSKLGGKLIPSSQPPFKKEVAKYVDYLNTQVNKANIDVSMMKEATPENIMQADPDVVVIATGGDHLIPKIPGVDSDMVVKACDVLMNPQIAGSNVVVAGAGMVGCETALYLKQQGKDVTLVEMAEKILPEPTFQINEMIINELIGENEIEVLVNTEMKAIQKDKVIVEDLDGVEKEILCDSVVLAVGFTPNNSLSDALEGKEKEVYVIGDSAEPRKVLNAVWEGFHIARTI